ncbi:hypothetical protein LOK49_Contig32G00003 [Camellia lanceoleosa]|nr:hypothetical protein LOK49_Contig32G00003 [Camellia lanceoleosa]
MAESPLFPNLKLEFLGYYLVELSLLENDCHGSTEHEESAPCPWTIVSVQVAEGIFAGATASCITTPLDTIKTRLQNDEIAKTFVDLIIVNYWIGKFKPMSYPLFSGYNHAQSI